MLPSGGTGWKIHEPLYIFCNFPWIYNYFKFFKFKNNDNIKIVNSPVGWKFDLFNPASSECLDDSLKTLKLETFPFHKFIIPESNIEI